MQVSDLLTPNQIAVGLAVRSKEALLELLASEVSRITGLPERSVLSALVRREELGSTGVGQGIALPHAPVAGLDRVFCYLMLLSDPVEYGAVDEEPVDIVLLLLLPEGQQQYLKALSLAARKLRSDRLRAALRQAETSDVAYHAICAEAPE